jgi:hypothetical protein
MMVLWALAGVFVPPSILYEVMSGAEAFSSGIQSSRVSKTHHRHFPASAGCGSTSLVVSWPPTPLQTKGTSPTSLESAKILPFLYTGFSGALLYKAKTVVLDADKIVLVAMAALSFVEFSRSDNVYLASAKAACKKTIAISAETGKKEPSGNALKWRRAVRLRILGRVVGLSRMALARDSPGLWKGAALVLVGSLSFLVNGGGGDAFHDENGEPNPLPKEDALKKLNTTFVLFVALVAAGVQARTAPVRWWAALLGTVFGLVTRTT